jgi:peptidoglycan/LPS O-acetylase OafA/YrhL
MLQHLHHVANKLWRDRRCSAALPPPFCWLDYGTFDVTLFFALSGFTLYTSYGANLFTDTPRFFVRRVCRIYPAFVISLAAYLAIEGIIRATIRFPEIPIYP